MAAFFTTGSSARTTRELGGEEGAGHEHQAFADSLTTGPAAVAHDARMHELLLHWRA